MIALEILAAALPPSWEEIGKILVPLGVIVAAIWGLIRLIIGGKKWLDDNYTTRREFEQLVADSARNQKLIDLLAVGRKKHHERKHDDPVS